MAKPEDMTYRQAFIIGLFPVVGHDPGVSRSASTIVGGLILGLKRKTIVEFSFLLAVPTMAAATGYDLLKSGSMFSLDQLQFLGVGFVMSFAIALLSIKVSPQIHPDAHIYPFRCLPHPAGYPLGHFSARPRRLLTHLRTS